MNPHDFTNLLFLLVPYDNIKIPYSFKISKKDNVVKTNSKRVCFLIDNVEGEVLSYLISVFNNNETLHHFIRDRFSKEKRVGFGFSGQDRKFYIENKSIDEEFTIEAYEWKGDNPNLMKMRNYRKCAPHGSIKKIPNQLHQYLNFRNCQYRDHENQLYVQFKVNSLGNLDQELNTNCINCILLAFDKFFPSNLSTRKELEIWLYSFNSLKPAWIQFNDNSFTIYLREF